MELIAAAFLTQTDRIVSLVVMIALGIFITWAFATAAKHVDQVAAERDELKRKLAEIQRDSSGR